MFTTMLTKRRAVDHCRTRSALCRMRWRDAATPSRPAALPAPPGCSSTSRLSWRA